MTENSKDFKLDLLLSNSFKTKLLLLLKNIQNNK